jgi:hypothetical protein
MSSRQGINRIQNGIIRKLNKAELTRGYIFLTRDLAIEEILRVSDFDVKIIGKTLNNRKLDKYGRFMVPRKLMENMNGQQHYKFSVLSKKILEIDVVG